mmetsp:Transcript_21197/g.72983  ORF Transcript_21197/g.72983 Transcript_21197/m.72983 type:complete len:235 (+) Transcript_21197:145-849(+)
MHGANRALPARVPRAMALEVLGRRAAMCTKHLPRRSATACATAYPPNRKGEGLCPGPHQNAERPNRGAISALHEVDQLPPSTKAASPTPDHRARTARDRGPSAKRPRSVRSQRSSPHGGGPVRRGDATLGAAPAASPSGGRRASASRRPHGWGRRPAAARPRLKSGAWSTSTQRPARQLGKWHNFSATAPCPVSTGWLSHHLVASNTPHPPRCRHARPGIRTLARDHNPITRWA